MNWTSFFIGWACAFFWVAIAAGYIGPALEQDAAAIPRAMFAQGTVILVIVGAVKLIWGKRS